jgi:predicted secreted hydrolase
MLKRRHFLHRGLTGLMASSASVGSALEAWSLPQPGAKFTFPRDDGSHPSFRTEWWYVTGHLAVAGVMRFGFQLTFFRQGSAPGGPTLFLAHCAVADLQSGRHLSEERLNREGWDAWSSTTSMDVHNGNWSLRRVAEGIELRGTVLADVAISLMLREAKPLVVFGKDGVSQKGASAAAASHYLTYPRLDCRGQLRMGAETLAVTGLAWMDHEFSSSQLDVGQVGWDWASLQLDDGRELMVYRLRRADGSSDPAGTTLASIDRTGGLRQVGAGEFQWVATQYWTSPVTKARYPIGACIEVGGEVFTLRPLMEAQELGSPIAGLPYWEGACEVRNAADQMIGRAFLELAGYTGDLASQLRGR